MFRIINGKKVEIAKSFSNMDDAIKDLFMSA